MFWLRNWDYLITSFFSSTLLLSILIFQSDVSQSLFFFNNLSYSAVSFADNTILTFFQLQNENNNNNNNNNFNTRKINYCVFNRSACAKLTVFQSAEKFLKSNKNKFYFGKTNSFDRTSAIIKLNHI